MAWGDMRQGTPCLLGSGSRVEEEGGGRRVGAGGPAGGRRWRTRGDVPGKRQESGPPGPRSASGTSSPSRGVTGHTPPGAAV